MNYIAQLQLEVKQLKAQVAVLETGIDTFNAHLVSPKFTSPGDLQGYINTGDVARVLSELKTDGIIARDSISA